MLQHRIRHAPHFLSFFLSSLYLTFQLSLALYTVVVLVGVDASHCAVEIVVSPATPACYDELFWVEAVIVRGVMTAYVAEEVKVTHSVVLVVFQYI